ncbi:MAG: EAL domain-containing protein [Rhodocyclaceae bacterium]|nr:MAG: EAL domain-containing protein [Rhodocyclaceae bacterium]
MTNSLVSEIESGASLLLRELLACLPLGIAITDRDGQILQVNGAFSALTGYQAHEVTGKHLEFIASPRLPNPDAAPGAESWGQRRDGSLFPRHQVLHPVNGQDGALAHQIAVISDLTKHKQDESHIERLAYYDELTGLPNRQFLLQQLAGVIEREQRENTTCAVLLIDLDRFKTFNDSLGHSAGDVILKEAARRIESAIRRSDTVSRQGGDEFIAVLSQLHGPEDAAIVANNILAAMAKPIPVGQHQLTITPSIGISLFPHDANTPESLIRCADTAMYHAKEQGRNNFQYYTPVLNHRVQERMSLETALRGALLNGEFSLHFQPQIALDNGMITGAEALLRWRRSNGSWMPPDQFIPVAEDCGLIVPLGQWVLEEACRQRRQWNELGLPAFPIAVNCSALQFRQPAFKDQVVDTIAAHGLGPQHIELEITESVLMASPECAQSVLGELKALGIQVAMDDFGTGYSSLAYLKQFPVDRLKIDAAFIRGLDQDATSRAIVQSIISLGRSLGLSLVAEGVETQDMRLLLNQLGCDYAQGYGICHPLPAAQFEAWVRDLSSR